MATMTRLATLRFNEILYRGAASFPANQWYIALADNTDPETLTSNNSAVSSANDTVNIASHGLYTGTRVRVTGSPPVGMFVGTDYFVIVESTSLIQFALTLADALDDNPIDITASSGAFSVVVRPAITTQDGIGHFAQYEVAAPGYSRQLLTIPEAVFSEAQFNRANNPTVGVVISAPVENGISFSHAAVLAGATIDNGSDQGMMIHIFEEPTLQTIPAGLSFTFNLSLNFLNPAFTTPGTN